MRSYYVSLKYVSTLKCTMIILGLLLCHCQDRVDSDLHPIHTLQQNSVEQSQYKVVYGEESRLEYYQIESIMLRQRMMNSTAVLIRPNKIQVNVESVQFSSSTLGEAKRLCDGEVFFDQPNPGYCSATLIGDDIMLTAGHCIDDQSDCNNTQFLFRYLYTDVDQIPDHTIDDLYSCSEVITRRNDDLGDYAVVRLDRPVSGELTPAPMVDREYQINNTDPLVLIGSPNGIPFKVDQEGVTIANVPSSHFFQMSVDAFGGHSGSALYNPAGEITGILVSGRGDYYLDTQFDCHRVNQVSVNINGVPVDGRGGETGVKSTYILDELCEVVSDVSLCRAGSEAGSESGSEAGSESGSEAGSEAGSESGSESGSEVFACSDAQENDDQATQANQALLASIQDFNFCDDAQDWLVFTARAGDRFDFETYAGELQGASDTLISLYDEEMNLVIEDDDSGAGLMSWIKNWSAPNDNNYYIKLHSYNDRFGADLTYRFMLRYACSEDEWEVHYDANEAVDLHNDRRDSAFPATLPIVENLSLCDEDWIKIEITQAQVDSNLPFLIKTQVSNGTDTILTLWKDEEVISENDDRSAQVRSSEIIWTFAEAGTYYIQVSSYRNLYGGNDTYTLIAEWSEVCDNLDNDSDGVIDEDLTNCLLCEADLYEDNDLSQDAVGIGLGSILVLNHCDDAQDWYSINLLQDERIDIETYTERNSDTILNLYSPDGQLMFTNDDRRQGEYASLLSDITITESGLHWISVNQFSENFGPEYPYQLLVRQACIIDDFEHDDYALEANEILLFSDDINREALSVNRDMTLCDPDWIKVDLQAFDRIRIQSEIHENMAIDILDDFGRSVLARVPPQEVDQSFIWEAPITATYWIRITHIQGIYGGDAPYRLLLSALEMEVCDGEDNDLDARIDERVLNTCGVCGDLPIEVCDGEDNDCDGRTDEATLNACGVCGDLPVEVCDFIDNDCDGRIDEGTVNACGECGALPVEICDEFDNDCDGRTDEGTLNDCGVCGDTPVEICDGEDNDCDGRSDENTLNDCGVCGILPMEICDGEDNDCDGRIDEGTQNLCGACGDTPREVCDGEDNDCDERIDEGCDDNDAGTEMNEGGAIAGAESGTEAGTSMMAGMNAGTEISDAYAGDETGENLTESGTSTMSTNEMSGEMVNTDENLLTGNVVDVMSTNEESDNQTSTPSGCESQTTHTWPMSLLMIIFICGTIRRSSHSLLSKS